MKLKRTSIRLRGVNMAWRKKTLALFIFLVFITVLILQGYLNIIVKLPTYDHLHNHPTEKPPGHVKSSASGDVRIKLKRGFYKVIKARALYKNESVFDNDRKISEYTNDIDLLREVNKAGFPKHMLESDVMSITSGHVTKQSGVSIAKEHAQRIENLQNACHDFIVYRRGEQRKGNLSEFYYSRDYKFAYCKVPKSGSTFWMNVFLILSKGEKYSKLISRMSRMEIHERTRLFITDPGRILHSNIPTIISSRNPFSRLFSAYVDKVYVPLFWHQFTNMKNVTALPPYNITGTIDVLKSSNLPLSSRLYKYRNSLRQNGMLTKKNVTQTIRPLCANNASFEDFLRFIISEIKSGRALEPHWAPISHLCHPCRFNTFKIIKQETFSRDVEHALKSVGVNLSHSEWLKSSLNENRAESSIPGIITVIMNKNKQRSVKNCIHQTEVVRRLWKSFQIQGFISKEIDFPDELLKVDAKEYENKVTEVVLGAISQKPMTSADRLQQRDFYLKQAFHQLPADIITDIQDIYYLDFLLFGYPMNPPK